MKAFIQQSRIKHILFFTLIITGLISCNDKLDKIPKEVYLLTTKGIKVKTILAVSPKDQVRGYSGTRSKDVGVKDGMLFFNTDARVRGFWMPDTYFNLDIFFLDNKMKVIDVDRDVQHHIGYGNNEDIPRARPVYATHVFEMRADSDISKSIKIGDVLEIESLSEDSISPEQITQGIRQLK
jgi:uncharacterized membrane protein (UPF0127 family)